MFEGIRIRDGQSGQFSKRAQEVAGFRALRPPQLSLRQGAGQGDLSGRLPFHPRSHPQRLTFHRVPRGDNDDNDDNDVVDDDDDVDANEVDTLSPTTPSTRTTAET